RRSFDLINVSAIKCNSHRVVLSITQTTLSIFLDTRISHSRNCSIDFLCSIYNRYSKGCPHDGRNSRTWVQNVIQMEYRINRLNPVAESPLPAELRPIQLSR